MEQPPETLWTTLVSCTEPSREKEFNEWYDGVHLPDLLKVPEILGVYRYRNLRPKLREDEPSYLTICRIKSEDSWGSLRRSITEDTRKRAEEGRIIDCIKAHFINAWQPITRQGEAPAVRTNRGTPPDGMPPALLMVLTNCTDPDRETEFNEWYNNVHIPDLLQTSGLRCAWRYRSLRWRQGQSDPKYLAIYWLDSRDPWELVRQIASEDKGRSERGRMIDFVRVEFGSSAYTYVGR